MAFPGRLQWALILLLIAPAARAADWPTYRADAARSGWSAETLSHPLRLHWVHRAAHAPRPAWPTCDRMRYDTAFQPIVLGGRVFFGSSADDQVYALDARTGRTEWTFFTGAPVRFAPAGWRDRVFVASDDGWLYALAASDGRLLWKRRGGPGDDMVLGNERMVSRWAARGGPVLFGGVLYFTAGIWQTDGVYVYALNPETGEVLWVNSESGGLYMPQPHPGANAKSGVSAQGYLLATDEHLFVPTGRAVPAAFNRADGKLAYYHLQKNWHRGGTWAMAADRFLLNAGQLFERATGEARATYAPGAMAAVPDGLVQAGANVVASSRWKDLVRKTRDGKQEAYRGVERYREAPYARKVEELIVAGQDAVLGGDGEVAVLNLPSGKVVGSHKVEGKALGLAAADGRLIVSTDAGILYCFGSGAPSRPAPAPRAAASPRVRGRLDCGAAAEEIVRRSGVREGFCVDLGCGAGDLALELARRTRLQIYGVERDPDRVAEARRKLAAAGLYGARVTIHQADPEQTPYPAMFADLVVSSAALAGSGEASGEARRLQRPYGGAVCAGRPGALRVERRGALPGAGSWTHQNAGPANTLCSGDEIARGPVEMFWFRDVDFEISNRHGQGPAPLCHNGVIVAQGVDGVCAVDVYNGRTRWTYPIAGLLKEYDGQHHDVGVGDTGSGCCVSDDSAYVRFADRCLRLDLRTGRKLAEFRTPVPAGAPNRAWGYLAYSNGLLFGSVADEAHTVSPRYAGLHLWTESVLFFALDPATGKVKWQYRPKASLRHNAIAVAGGRVYLIDRPLAPEDRIEKPTPNGRHRPRLKPGQHPGGTLLALDAATGREIWRQEAEVFGTQLAVSEKHGVLLMSFQAVPHDFFRLPSEVGDRLAGFDAATGQRLWDKQARYSTRPVINDEVIYTIGGAWNIRNGADVPFTLKRSHGCGQVSGSARLLLFRSATLGYMDLARGTEVQNFGGVRPGCWINAIAAGGLVLMPNGMAKCTCAYQMEAWVALQNKQ